MAWDPEDIVHAVESEAAEVVASQDEEDPLVGTMLRGKWKVLKRLGAGAFGTVYKVEDVAGGWVEAMKILSVDRLTGVEGENMKKRFLREAQIMKRLGTESKHIVGLSAYEEDFDAGLVYLVLVYVEGRRLARVPERACPSGSEPTRTWGRPRGGWSAIRSSNTMRRAALARVLAVMIFMPGDGRRMHDAASTRSPSISTMHARQLPSGR